MQRKQDDRHKVTSEVKCDTFVYLLFIKFSSILKFQFLFWKFSFQFESSEIVINDKTCCLY